MTRDERDTADRRPNQENAPFEDEFVVEIETTAESVVRDEWLGGMRSHEVGEGALAGGNGDSLDVGVEFDGYLSDLSPTETPLGIASVGMISDDGTVYVRFDRDRALEEYESG